MVFWRGRGNAFKWENLTDIERRSWEDLAATLRAEAATVNPRAQSAYLVETARREEREACAEIANTQAEKYFEMGRKWEASGSCSASNIHEASGAAIVGREIRDAIRRRVT
jgi:hypothetical protein